MTPVFADTFYWVALTNPWDEYAEEAQRFDVLLSAGNVCRMRAVATVKEILSDEAVTVIPQTHGSFLAGVDFYAKRPDKGYSLTDCISMQTMYREGISEILTNDHHFEQEGFRDLFRPA